MGFAALMAGMEGMGAATALEGAATKAGGDVVTGALSATDDLEEEDLLKKKGKSKVNHPALNTEVKTKSYEEGSKLGKGDISKSTSKSTDTSTTDTPNPEGSGALFDLSKDGEDSSLLDYITPARGLYDLDSDNGAGEDYFREDGAVFQPLPEKEKTDEDEDSGFLSSLSKYL